MIPPTFTQLSTSMKLLPALLLILLAGIYSCPLQAQGPLRLQIGLNFPTNDFGDDDILTDTDAGGAGIGIGVGAHYLHPLSVAGLHLFGSLNINHFELKGDVKEDIEELALSNANVKIGRYFSIPLAAGVAYQFAIENGIPVYVHFGLALNFLKLTSTVYENALAETTFNYDLSSTVGIKLGAGVFVSENVFVEVNYYGLGEHDVDGEIESTNAPDSDFDGDLRMGYFTLGIGVAIEP